MHAHVHAYKNACVRGVMMPHAACRTVTCMCVPRPVRPPMAPGSSRTPRPMRRGAGSGPGPRSAQPLFRSGWAAWPRAASWRGWRACPASGAARPRWVGGWAGGWAGGGGRLRAWAPCLPARTSVRPCLAWCSEGQDEEEVGVGHCCCSCCLHGRTPSADRWGRGSLCWGLALVPLPCCGMHACATSCEFVHVQSAGGMGGQRRGQEPHAAQLL